MKDGREMRCSICGNPIVKGQPFQASISQKIGKRDCYHFVCAGGTITVIGQNEVSVFGK